jgi:hypothetical protein
VSPSHNGIAGGKQTTSQKIIKIKNNKSSLKKIASAQVSTSSFSRELEKSLGIFFFCQWEDIDSMGTVIYTSNNNT